MLLCTTVVLEGERGIKGRRERRKEGRKNSAMGIQMTQAYLPEEIGDEQLHGKGDVRAGRVSEQDWNSETENLLSKGKKVAGKVQKALSHHISEISGTTEPIWFVFAGGSKIQEGPRVKGIQAVEKRPGLKSKSQEDGASQMLKAKGLG